MRDFVEAARSFPMPGFFDDGEGADIMIQRPVLALTQISSQFFGFGRRGRFQGNARTSAAPLKHCTVVRSGLRATAVGGTTPRPCESSG